MPRKKRIFTDAGTYHLVTRGNNRQNLFKKQADFEFYLDTFRRLKKDYSFDIYHYCLMTNHVHFLIRFFDGECLQKIMQRVNLRFAKYFRREYKYFGHVFQDRFKSFPIEKDCYLLECGRYIERNPLSAKMVRGLSDYPWSSYLFYSAGKFDDLLTPNPLFLELDKDVQARRQIYINYLNTDRPYEEFIDQAILA